MLDPELHRGVHSFFVDDVIGCCGSGGDGDEGRGEGDRSEGAHRKTLEAENGKGLHDDILTYECGDRQRIRSPPQGRSMRMRVRLSPFRTE